MDFDWWFSISGFPLASFYCWMRGFYCLVSISKFLLVGFHSCVSIDGLRLVGFYWWVFCGWVSFDEFPLLDEWVFIAWFPLVSFYWWVSINVFLLMGFDWWVSIGG